MPNLLSAYLLLNHEWLNCSTFICLFIDGYWHQLRINQATAIPVLCVAPSAIDELVVWAGWVIFSSMPQVLSRFLRDILRHHSKARFLSTATSPRRFKLLLFLLDRGEWSIMPEPWWAMMVNNLSQSWRTMVVNDGLMMILTICTPSFWQTGYWRRLFSTFHRDPSGSQKCSWEGNGKRASAGSSKLWITEHRLDHRTLLPFLGRVIRGKLDIESYCSCCWSSCGGMLMAHLGCDFCCILSRFVYLATVTTDNINDPAIRPWVRSRTSPAHFWHFLATKNRWHNMAQRPCASSERFTWLVVWLTF